VSFIDFARGYGVEIDYSKLYPSDRIKRCGTTEKPKSSNGAYFWDGERGWVMNWAGMKIYMQGHGLMKKSVRG